MDSEHINRFEIEYDAVGKLVEHYSNLRSALTTFCLTASLAAFTAHFTAKTFEPLNFPFWAGFIMLAAGVGVCLVFSWRTSKELLKYKRLWKWRWRLPNEASAPNANKYPLDRKWLGSCSIICEMLGDLMNWVMIAGVGLTMVAVLIFEIEYGFSCCKQKSCHNHSYNGTTIVTNTLVPVFSYVTNFTVVQVTVTNCLVTNIPVTNSIITDRSVTNAVITDVHVGNSANPPPTSTNRVNNINVFGIQVIRTHETNK